MAKAPKTLGAEEFVVDCPRNYRSSLIQKEPYYFRELLSTCQGDPAGDQTDNCIYSEHVLD
jgi:hypothetical protein